VIPCPEFVRSHPRPASTPIPQCRQIKSRGNARHTIAGSYGDALRRAAQTGAKPDVTAAHRPGTLKYGTGDCWLTLRGVSTLSCRMRAHLENASAVAAYLRGHSAVEKVHYPGLPDHAGHPLAARQMAGFGGMLSFQVRGAREQAMAVAANLWLLTRATSFGGPHSFVEHRASIEGPGTKTPQNLLRISIGLENSADLIEDLDQALAIVQDR
jgi:cystathionine beta-lyase/cystathionine gamma-synthase